MWTAAAAEEEGTGGDTKAVKAAEMETKAAVMETPEMETMMTPAAAGSAEGNSS